MPFPRGMQALRNLVPLWVHWPLSITMSCKRLWGRANPGSRHRVPSSSLQFPSSLKLIRQLPQICKQWPTFAWWCAHTKRSRGNSSSRLNLVWQETIQVCSLLGKPNSRVGICGVNWVSASCSSRPLARGWQWEKPAWQTSSTDLFAGQASSLIQVMWALVTLMSDTWFPGQDFPWCAFWNSPGPEMIWGKTEQPEARTTSSRWNWESQWTTVGAFPQQEILLYDPQAVSATERASLLPKDDTNVLPQTAATKAMQSIGSEKCRKHLKNRTRTVSFEYSGSQKKENKASSWKNISGA